MKPRKASRQTRRAAGACDGGDAGAAEGAIIPEPSGATAGGQTALMWAAHHGHADVVAALHLDAPFDGVGRGVDRDDAAALIDARRAQAVAALEQVAGVSAGIGRVGDVGEIQPRAVAVAGPVGAAVLARHGQHRLHPVAPAHGSFFGDAAIVDPRIGALQKFEQALHTVVAQGAHAGLL